MAASLGDDVTSFWIIFETPGSFSVYRTGPDHPINRAEFAVCCIGRQQRARTLVRTHMHTLTMLVDCGGFAPCTPTGALPLDTCSRVCECCGLEWDCTFTVCNGGLCLTVRRR